MPSCPARDEQDAGTAGHDGRVGKNGGRVLDATATGETVADARAAAYDAASRIQFAGMQFRHELAYDAEPDQVCGERR